MFIFRWLKRLLVVIGIATVAWWSVQFVKTNSPARKKIEDFQKSSLWQEGVKDMRAWASEIFKGVGKKLDEEDITSEEKKQLDDIIRKELDPKYYGSDTSKNAKDNPKVRGVSREH